jgi:ribonuclease P protein component
MPVGIFKFKKSERLCSEISVNRLFSEGEAFISYPLRFVYLRCDKNDEVLQVIISVPKKRFKRAVKRNLLRRRIKEAYRLQKNDLQNFLQNKNASLHLAVTYISDEELPFDIISRKLHEGIHRIEKSLE